MDYLLIRLITVFDPAFCRVFFLPVFLAWLQANEDMDAAKNNGGDDSKRMSFCKSAPGAMLRVKKKVALENQSHSH
ncbi:hypothetical protein [Pseudomonas fluorescens]|uniref:hypothetical protein n=1 Tax=Pseudomonas fluorescens TaxID=294 RepID=UPI0013792C10|nr:hypothetical protein [Pseudomonas fluorescens]